MFLIMFVLKNIMVVFISFTFLDILSNIKTENPVEIEEAFLCRRVIHEYQRGLFPVNSNKLAPNFDGISLSVLL